MNKINYDYEEKFIGLGYVYEELHNPLEFRVISEDGENYLLSRDELNNDCCFYEDDIEVGDIGKLIYCCDNSRGWTKFKKDDTLQFDKQKMKKNYEAKYKNANLKI